MSAKVTTTAMTEATLRAWGNREDALDPRYGARMSAQQLRKEFAHVALVDVVAPLLDELHDALDADDHDALIKVHAKIGAAIAKDWRPMIMA